MEEATFEDIAMFLAATNLTSQEAESAQDIENAVSEARAATQRARDSAKKAGR